MRRVLIAFALLAPLWFSVALPAGAVTPRGKVIIDVGDGVSPEDVAITREGIRYAQDFFLRTFGDDVEKPLTVKMIYDPHPHGEHVSFERGYVITQDAWDMRGYSYLQRLRYKVHGYTHIWQHDLSGIPSTPYQVRRGPAWLIEGSADYIAFEALAASGLASPDDLHEYVVRLANGVHSPNPPSLPRLQDLANEPDLFGPGRGCCSYAFGALAVEMLTADKGIQSLRDYFAAMGKGNSWVTAFTNAFGQTPDAFYTAFEARRPVLLTPTGRSIVVLDRTPPFNEAPAAISVSSVFSPIERGEQGLLVGTTAPGAHCTLHFVSASGNPLLTEPTYADSAGTVFWLFSVRERLAKGTATATVDCGGAAVSAPVELT